MSRLSLCNTFCCFTYLAGAVHAVAAHGTVGVRVAVTAGGKVTTGAVHAESTIAVKVSGAVAAGGEGAALAVDAVPLVVAVGGAEAVAALIRFRSRACERSHSYFSDKVCVTLNRVGSTRHR